MQEIAGAHALEGREENKGCRTTRHVQTRARTHRILSSSARPLVEVSQIWGPEVKGDAVRLKYGARRSR